MAVRDGKLACSLSTFYNYARLLGFENRKNKRKSDNYNALKTSKPNQIWCADVTIFKTHDGTRHHIHILMDHFSKKILGYRIENSSNGVAIRNLLQEAFEKYKPHKTMFLTDGGSENKNSVVTALLESLDNSLFHKIAQKDVVFSNSAIEALNKILKHQFLYPRGINYKSALDVAMEESVSIYNAVRPQLGLKGNTPNETFDGIPMNYHKFTIGFKEKKLYRIAQNQKSSCQVCH